MRYFHSTTCHQHISCYLVTTVLLHVLHLPFYYSFTSNYVSASYSVFMLGIVIWYYCVRVHQLFCCLLLLIVLVHIYLSYEIGLFVLFLDRHKQHDLLWFRLVSLCLLLFHLASYSSSLFRMVFSSFFSDRCLLKTCFRGELGMFPTLTKGSSYIPPFL